MTLPTPTPWYRRRRNRLFAAVLGGVGLVGGGHVARAGGHAASCECAVPTWSAAPIAPPAAPASGSVLRVATYNIHSGLGPSLTFGQPRAVVERNLDRIADAVARASSGGAPDVVGLNEVDLDARRSGGIDEAAYLARALGRITGSRYEAVTGTTWERTTPGREVRFGNAVLVRHRVLAREAIRYDDDPGETRDGDRLPAVRSPRVLERLVREARGAVKVTLDAGSGPIDVLVTHLDAFSQSDREAQAVHLLRHHVTPGRTTLLLGDLNAVPTELTLARRPFQDDLTHDLLTSGDLVDARLVLAARDGEADLDAFATFPVAIPCWPLDGALATSDLVPLEARTFGGDASDHLGFFAAFRLVVQGDAAQVALRAWHDAVRARQVAHLARCCAPSTDDVRARQRRLVETSGFRDLLTTRR